VQALACSGCTPRSSSVGRRSLYIVPVTPRVMICNWMFSGLYPASISMVLSCICCVVAFIVCGALSVSLQYLISTMSTLRCLGSRCILLTTNASGRSLFHSSEVAWLFFTVEYTHSGTRVPTVGVVVCGAESVCVGHVLSCKLASKLCWPMSCITRDAPSLPFLTCCTYDTPSSVMSFRVHFLHVRAAAQCVVSPIRLST